MARHALIIIAVLGWVVWPHVVFAQDATVSLPHVFRDDSGSNWDVQFDGSIGDGGNDLYDGGGRLFVDNIAQYQSPTQQAIFDAGRNELQFPSIQMGGVNLSRRVAVLADLSAVRFTEILENPTGAPVKVQLRCYFNMGGSVQQALPLVDEKHPRAALGYAIGDQNNAVAMIAGGRKSKVQGRFEYRLNDDNVNIFFDLEVPAHQTMVVVHFQLRRRNASESAQAWKEIKEKDLLKTMPRDLRKRVVNFPTGDGFAGDLEVLRGEGLDVVELRGGDTYRGKLKIDHYRLQTLYGPINLPVEKVVCLINIGRYRPSQLLVTDDGEVFAGRVDFEAFKLQLTSGQYTTIPLSQVTRLGYRRRVGEPDEWDFENKTAAYLRGGERVRVNLPGRDFNLATTSGPIRLTSKVISSVVFQDVDNNVPEVHLIDGSRISALLGASNFDMTLAGPGAQQHVCMPAAALLRFSFAPEQETDYLTARFRLANKDELVGTIGGTLSLETPFDTIHVEGNQIKEMAHLSSGDHDVRITLWDDSTLSGRLVESQVPCLLKCGVSLSVPISLVEVYHQPLASPSPGIVARIRRMARALDADSWKVRSAAQEEIMSIGPPAMSVLKEIRPVAAPEARQRIDLILNGLSQQLEKSAQVQSPVVAAPAEVFPGVPQQQINLMPFDGAAIR